MPLNPDREPTKLEQINVEAYAHAEGVAVTGLVIALIVGFTMLGAPLTVASALLLGVAVVYLVQWVR